MIELDSLEGRLKVLYPEVKEPTCPVIQNWSLFLIRPPILSSLPHHKLLTPDLDFCRKRNLVADRPPAIIRLPMDIQLRVYPSCHNTLPQYCF